LSQAAPQPDSGAADETRKKALKKALGLLKHRDRSVTEMSDRLSIDFPPEAVSSVVSELVEIDYINDRRLARQLINESVNRRHHGPRRVRHELQKKGINPADHDDLLAECMKPEAITASALAATQAHFRGREPANDDRTLRRLAGYLGRRGFPDATIRAMVQRIRQGGLWDHPE
jgi:regulatory protein